MPEHDTSFVERFLAFYESCAPEEQEVLDLMATAALVVRDDLAEPEVSGFQTSTGRPFLLQDMLSSVNLMSEMLSNVSKTRSDISMTFARNARA